MRTLLVRLAVPLLALGLLAAPAAATPVAPGAAGPSRDVHATLTLKVKGCEGCEIVAMSATTEDFENVWSSKETKVADGAAVFSVPAEHMNNMSFTIHAPWEGRTGFAAGIVTRYAKTKPGAKISFTAARSMKRASGCWAGTTEMTATLKVKVRKVKVDGLGGKVWGTLAWMSPTAAWQGPMQQAWGGAIGRQDVLFCKPKA